MTPTVKPNRKYQTALRQEQAEMTRQRIMDAARRLLLRGSYASVRMEEIAQEAGLRMAARVTRRIQEPCADLLRFMWESGDPNLLARYRAVENQRHEQER